MRYSLRDSGNKLVVPLQRTNYLENSFSYSGAALWKSLPCNLRMTPIKTIVISTKDVCPILLANDGYFGQACTLFYFYSCLFCKFKLIKRAIKLLLLLLLIKSFNRFINKVSTEITTL